MTGRYELDWYESEVRAVYIRAWVAEIGCCWEVIDRKEFRRLSRHTDCHTFKGTQTVIYVCYYSHFPALTRAQALEVAVRHFEGRSRTIRVDLSEW